MSSSSDELLGWVRASGVVPPEQLDEFLASPSAPKDPSPKELLSALVTAGLVTKFQAGLLRGGKYKGFRLGSYVILDKLGAGGMGQVFRARHATLPKEIAIKVLPPSFKSDPVALARFIREARTCASISHPNIVAVYDVLPDVDPPHILMEFVPGISLQGAVAEHGAFSPGETADVGAQACTGLQKACEVGLVHRDIKPPNLLLTKSGQVKILDFGIARIKSTDDDGLTMQGNQKAILGTADYLAPEQAVDSSNVDSRADIYAMGATLYYLLAGHPPFPEKSTTAKLIRKQVADPVPIGTRRPDVPPGLSAVIQQMLARDPAARPQTPAAAAALLAAFAHVGSDYLSRLFGAQAETNVPGSSLVLPPEVPASGAMSTAAAHGSGYFTVPSYAPASGAFPLPPASGAYVPHGPGSSFFVPPADGLSVNGEGGWMASGLFDPAVTGAGSHIAPGDSRTQMGQDGSGRIDFRPTLPFPGTVVDSRGSDPTLVNQSAMEDTTPDTQAAPKSGRIPRKDHTGRRMAIGAVGFAVIALGGVALALSGVFSSNPTTAATDPDPHRPPQSRLVHVRAHTVIVSKNLNGAARSIREGLDKAKVGSRVEVRDDVWEESLDVNPSWFVVADVTLVGAAPGGKKVMWRPPQDAPQDKPWLTFRDGSGLKIENFAFDATYPDGKAKHRLGPLLSGTALTFSGCEFRKFGEAGVILHHTRNSPAPVVVEKCRFLQEGWPDGNPDTGPCGVQIGGPGILSEDAVVRENRFEGKFAAGVRVNFCIRTTIELNRFLGPRNGIFYSGQGHHFQGLINRNVFSGVDVGLRFHDIPQPWDNRTLRIQGNLFDQTRVLAVTEGPLPIPRDPTPPVMWDRPVNPKVGIPAGDVRRFRKTFELPEGPVPPAVLEVNAGKHRVWVNGKPLTPAWVSSGQFVDSYNISSFLLPGKNVVAIGANGAADCPNKGGLLAWIRLAGKMSDLSPSITGWQVSAEDFPGWTTLKFDDSSWATATETKQDNKPYRPGLVWLGESAGTESAQAIEIGGFPNVIVDPSIRDGNPSLKPRHLGINLQRDPNHDDRVFLRIDPADLPADLRGKVGVPRP